MINILRKVKGRLDDIRDRQREMKVVAPLYAPDPNQLDPLEHLHEAMQWLKRAQDAGSDRGVAYGVRFGGDFDLSYPETTGYICQTFVEQGQLSQDQELIDRAVDMGDWEIAIQMSDGAVMGGKYNTDPSPAVFNTGMVLLGWGPLIRHTGEERFKEAARRACDWLLEMQEPNGNWIRGNSKFAAAGSTLYNVKAAWGLCEAGIALGNDEYVQAAVRNAEYCVSLQHANGWFPDCCLSDPKKPLLHTIAYTMQGLIGIGKLTERTDLIDAARLTADAQAKLMGDDGFLPGMQDANFRSAASWCCLTGSAQTSIVWSELFNLTQIDEYRQLAGRINNYLMVHHDIRNSDPRIRGGLAGSWPVHGAYGRLLILNWATKFLVDALSLHERSKSQ
jgi:hypothetical protein